MLPSGFDAIAVIAVTPAPAAVARPVDELIVAVEALLEVHTAALMIE